MSSTSTGAPRDARITSLPNYQEVVASDVRPAPPLAAARAGVDPGFDAVPRSRYTDKAFFDRETALLWPRVWQIACREEQIPEAGDCLVYESPGASILVVRGESGAIKAYYNTCMHRGMKLCMADTSVRQIRCPYHGFTWHLDGRIAQVPARADFPKVKDAELSLREVKVGRWGGFVFINRDPGSPSLESYLGNLPEHFAQWPREDAYLAIHIRKVLKANWKACIEGFIEAFHVAELHSQALPFSGDSSTQYDIWPGNDNISRFLEPSGIQSEQMPGRLSEQQVYDAMMRTMTGTEGAPPLPPGVSARAAMAEMSRQYLSQLDGRDYSKLSDSEALDPWQYSIFPNIVIFRSLGFPYLYRFLPVRDDPHSSTFDFMIFKPKPLDGSPIPEVQKIDLGPDDTYSACGAFPPWLGQIYDQDTVGLAMLQEGLRAGGPEVIHLSRYQEIRIRHLHQTLTKYVGTT